MRRSPALVVAALFIAAVPLAAGHLHAQAESAVEAIAPVLAAEDARRWDPAAIGRAASAPEPLARQKAALAIGRIGDTRGTPLLLRLLADPDTSVSVEAAFALGLLRDSSTAGPIIERLGAEPALDGETALEAITALAKIGGRRSAEFAAAVLQGRAQLGRLDPQPIRERMLAEAWRLGRAAPTAAMLPSLSDSGLVARQAAFYSLGRLRAPAALDRFLGALGDRDPIIRGHAARALVRAYADSGHRAPATMARLLLPLVDDDDPGVRINAMRTLGSYHDSTLAPRVASHVNDPFPQVQVQAAATLGDLGGSAATAALTRVLGTRAAWAVRREALLGLAAIDSAAFAGAWGAWRGSADWRDRATAAEGWAKAHGGPPAGDPFFLGDADGRVVAAGLQAWAGVVEGPDPRLLAAGRARLGHADAAVRSVAADVVARAPSAADLPALVAAYRRSATDSFPESMISALGALQALARRSAGDSARVSREFLAVAPAPVSYVVRGWAEDNWPEAGDRWGGAFPVRTGRTLQDYREIARRFVVPEDSTTRPHVVIETDQRGTLEIELAGRDAPLTVANFLRLVDQHFFDGNRWHRVVPNFVVQDGDPRGDGWGGPGGAIRDEINRRRYNKAVLGMALSGPDTGSSQWFINLSPQPHLDGTYTVFGQVVNGDAVLARILQGDLIRTIRR